ncbi:MAG: rRNA maturation RNase YbeY [Hornefia sp.]|nr:rRNA maturation RNase YbeY [Hornefia sp.]
MIIYFADESVCSEDIIEIMRKAAEYCIGLEGVDRDVCQVSVSFVDKEEIRALNKEYRGIDKITDVLSFPQYESGEDMKGPLIELGDVVICKERAEKQARDFGHSPERELIYLFVHSMLHLLGYDHMNSEEKKNMRAQEERVMEYLGLGRQRYGG